MRRPNSVPGLLLRLARHHRRTVLAGGAALVLAAALATLSFDPSPRCELTEQEWTYGRWSYDHLEDLRFDRDGSGSYYLGYGQAERWNLTFRWSRIGEDELLLTDFVHHGRDGRHPLDWRIRTRFTTECGDFVFHEDDPPWGDGSTHRYRCQLSLEHGIDDGPAAFYADRR